MNEKSQPMDARFRHLVEAVSDYAIFLLDPHGHILTWNIGAQKIKGYAPDEIIGQHFSRFYPREIAESGLPDRELEEAFAKGRFEDEGWRLRRDGSRFWANVLITALYREDGTLQGFSKITRDLTERKAQEEALRQSEERFRLMVDLVRGYAIFMLDPEGRVITWNAGAQRMKGYSAEEILGKHFSIFYPPEVVERGQTELELKVALAEGFFEDEGWRVRKDGTRFWANVVITALTDRHGQLRGFARVTRDMSERKRVEQLEDAGREMTEFLAMLAHELRNPLAPVRNAIAILRTRDLDAVSQQWARDVIDRQVGHLTHLVDDLLDVSRITSGKIILHKERIEMATVVARAVESSHPLIKERHHALEIHLSEEPLSVLGDLTRLVQIVMNLLNNAAKYTPENGRIHITLEQQGEVAELRVRDTGVGIPAKLLDKVFQLFVQGQRSLARSEGGLGVGLTLVRKLVELHGGTVTAFSDGAGQGSEFLVRLPLADSQPDRGQASEADTSELRPEPVGRRVLVVDDNRDSADSMAILLQVWGYTTHTAFSGPAAIESAKEFRPQVGILDIGLPGMNGYDVARVLRSMPVLSGITLVAMTGYGQDEDRRLGLEAGFDHHLVKPVEPAVLRALMESVAKS